MLEEIETFKGVDSKLGYQKNNSTFGNNKLAISVNDLCVKWDPVWFLNNYYSLFYSLNYLSISFFSFQNLAQPSLEKITINLEKGELLAVIGSVGCGKVSRYKYLKKML